jgi:hypothetical protein
VIAYSFETGVDTFLPGTTLSVATVPGATGIRASNRNGFGAGDEIKIDTGANQEIRKVVSVAVSNPSSPNPNVTLDAPLTLPHAAGVPVTGGIFFSAVNFQPPYATEGKFEALEFAAGNYGLLESALAYARDDDPPKVIMTGAWNSKTPIDSTFQYVNEPSVIRYTTDGTKPTNTSTLWNSTGPREPGQVFHITQTTTFRWLATDMKGNQSLGSKKFEIHP